MTDEWTLKYYKLKFVQNTEALFVGTTLIINNGKIPLLLVVVKDKNVKYFIIMCV